MAVQTLEVPKLFNYAKQTIPFVVKSNLINSGTPTSIDPLERAFRFVFDLEVTNSAGLYKTYASVAIPPRPDNFYSFIDVAPMLRDAITYDLGTHLATTAQPCPKSIIKFRLWCTERYLDANGNFVNGVKTSLGNYFAIDGGDNAPIENYLLDSVSVKKPLHHHNLAGTDLKVKAGEPFTLSWLARNDIGGNLLQYIHGNYGNFDDAVTLGSGPNGLPAPYTGIVTNPPKFTYGPITTGLPGPGIYAKGALLPNLGNTNAPVFTFTNLVLNPSTVYVFKIWMKSSNTAPNTISLNLGGVLVGTNFQTFYASGPNVAQTNTGWQLIQVYFQTLPGYNVGDFSIQIRLNSISPFVALNLMNGNIMNYDSATLEKIGQNYPVISKVEVVTDNNTVYDLTPTYTQNILPLNDTAKSRFDTPVGPYNTYLPFAQDPFSGFWIDNTTAIAKYFQVRIKNAANYVIGLSEKIYQDTTYCEIQDNFRLKWKNQLGGWDYFTFTKVSKASTAIERENYKKSAGTVDASGYSELTNDRGYQSLNIKLEDTYTVISDWIEDGTVKWMLDLFTSDEVYLLNPEAFQTSVTTNPYDLEWPVFVKQEDIEFMNNSIEAKLKNLVVNITPAIRFEEPTKNIY